MAHYTPDYKLQKAITLIDSLNESEENKLIKYYIEEQKNHIETLDRRIKEYQEVFNMIGKFLPR